MQKYHSLIPNRCIEHLIVIKPTHARNCIYIYKCLLQWLWKMSTNGKILVFFLMWLVLEPLSIWNVRQLTFSTQNGKIKTLFDYLHWIFFINIIALIKQKIWQIICMNVPGYCHNVGGALTVLWTFDTPIETAAAVATSEEKGIMVEFVPV